MKRQYSQEIANAVYQFLTEDDWNFDFQEDRGIFRFTLKLKGKIRDVQLIVDVHDTDFNIYGRIPLSVDCRDEEMMQRMSQFLHSANFGLRCGNFELDFRDGEIRYKTYTECEGLAAPTPEMIRSGIYCIAAMFDRYSEGITRIIFTDMDAESAIVLCEKSTREAPSDEEDDTPEPADEEDESAGDTPSEEDPVVTDFDVFDEEEEIADLLRMMREMREAD